MGMMQATFGLIWIGIVILFVLIGVSIIIIKSLVDYFKNIMKNLDKGENNIE